ncbi:MAG TPA: class I SAM-dependent methyltransferase [Flavobacterium sp.]|jgi:ubiquinone/menaquinone biosynthesis C-methylase UbiE
MRDNFSEQAAEYSKYRPTYPDEMIDYVVSLVSDKNTALDIATGNGQVAVKLAKHFKEVYATDISEEQLKNAASADNIKYQKGSAEDTGFDKHAFDLVVVAQAIHWFDFDKFYKEVKRILKKKDGILAVMGYGLFSTNADSDEILRKFYNQVLGPYWDPERRFLDDDYETIPFPLEEIQSEKFASSYEWSLEQLIGYLETWSAVQHYKKENNSSPVDAIRDELRESWEKSDKKIIFPMLLRIGKFKK